MRISISLYSYTKYCIIMHLHHFVLTIHVYFSQRIANHTRLGGPDQLCLERFAEALSDPESGFTYPALTGARKPSVVDAERFLVLS